MNDQSDRAVEMIAPQGADLIRPRIWPFALLLAGLILAAAALIIWDSLILDVLFQTVWVEVAIAVTAGASIIVAGLSLLAALKLYRLRHRRNSPAAGGLSLLAGSTFVVLSAHAGALLWSARDIADSYAGAIAQGTAVVELLGAGEIAVYGPIGTRLLHDILQFDTKTDPLATIRITSGGGLIGEALKIAQLVESRKISVIVEEYCLSACVIIAVASSESKAAQYAQFGIHRASLHAQPRTQIARSWEINGSAATREYLRDHGVPESFLIEADKHEGDSIYEISARDMVDAGAITYLMSEGSIIAKGPKTPW